MDNELDYYHLVIDINSFCDLKQKNNGWNILMSDNGDQCYNYYAKNDYCGKYDDDNGKKNLVKVGILGGGKVGKTFMLHKLLNKEYYNNIKTRGIGIIYPEIGSENQIVYLDTCNTLNTSLFSEKLTCEELFKLTNNERLSLMQELNNDQKTRNIFIEDFIIEKSDIIIIVVNYLSFMEQKFLNRLKDHKNIKKMFVIHNLQFFCEIKNIEEHIENIVKKSIFSNLKKQFIPNFDFNQKKYENNYKEKSYFYFKDKNFNNNQNQTVYHFFMGKEGSNAGKFFNDNTIEFIKDIINFNLNKTIFDIIYELKNFLSLNSSKYMIKDYNKERPILEEDLEVKSENDCKFLICKKDFKLKDCIINEMGIPNFIIDNSITPPYICYKGTYIKYKKGEIEEQWPALIIKTEMFVDSKDIKVLTILNDDNETMNIIISSFKKFEEDSEIEEVEAIEGNIKEVEFKIEIIVKIEEFLLDPSYKIIIKEPEKGIKIIYLKLIDDKYENENIKTEIIYFKEKKKKK